jgi:dTDP-4-amino-4,6-dideoxygalactose transaminase
MNDVNAAIGLANIPEARESVIQHRINAKYLLDNIETLNYAKLAPYDSKSSYWFLSIVLNDEVDRDLFSEYLSVNGVASSPVHYRNDRYSSTMKFAEGLLPGVEVFSNKQINVPCGWWTTIEELDHIINILKNYEA